MPACAGFFYAKDCSDDRIEKSFIWVILRCMNLFSRIFELEVIEINDCSGFSCIPYVNFAILLPKPWPAYFGVPMRDSERKDIGTMIFKITKYARESFGWQLRRFEAIELLPPDSEVPHPLLQLITFSVRSKEYS